MKEKLYQSMIELTNGRWSSSLIKGFAQSNLSKKVIPAYIKYFNIDIDEIPCHVHEFLTLHDFFIRSLKKDSRMIDQSESGIISPVDATIETFGDITYDGIFHVKGKAYTLYDMLGSTKIGKEYENGKFMILYLSPAEYHRIHAPVDGKVTRQYLLGKKSFPVNKWGLAYGKETISGNYRLLTELQMPNEKHCFHVKVGAMFVNSIELTNKGTEWRKGEEVGYFSFGSTVVLLFQEGSIEFSKEIGPGKFVQMGEKVANML
ncbi:phosphatidylserine decarboxylase [Psychrobacillus sp. FSL K6-2684]|uniref:phosphatidylserine decarboxylase n=1 Tax=Psychrobacillus faecigallinarum TaxID=2762235 RepID=A0ABR8R7N4_9BACI|nr:MULTISPECIES: phosphatidylserine decarboxylase [Psychrobacillus]MBD7943801.1 phosphatidylserine decarboxylase [Psychrobacillus faecigallinarum]QEY19313.1 phosphatidylserine decarboxylase [Psychrobacillus sp. AK 1817]